MYNTPFRIATVGESSVGKTSIVRCLIGEKFDSTETSTVGIDFAQITKFVDEKKVVIEIWDTAGQERFRSLVPVYCRTANAALVVFDITSQDSYNRVEEWINILKELGDEKRIIFVIGNKMDLVEDYVAVDLEKVKEEMKTLGYPCFFVSAKTGEGIDNMIDCLVATLIETFPKSHEQEPKILKSLPQEKEDKCC